MVGILNHILFSCHDTMFFCTHSPKFKELEGTVGLIRFHDDAAESVTDLGWVWRMQRFESPKKKSATYQTKLKPVVIGRIWHTYNLVGGFNPSENISQLGWLFPIYGKIKHVPNHQPDIYIYIYIMHIYIITYIYIHKYIYCRLGYNPTIQLFTNLRDQSSSCSWFHFHSHLSMLKIWGKAHNADIFSSFSPHLHKWLFAGNYTGYTPLPNIPHFAMFCL